MVLLMSEVEGTRTRRGKEGKEGLRRGMRNIRWNKERKGGEEG